MEKWFNDIFEGLDLDIFFGFFNDLIFVGLLFVISIFNKGYV